MLQIEGKQAIVVGGGEVAARKVTSLIKANASVTVVSPSLSDPLQQWVKAGKIQWMQKSFSKEDVADAFIVVAATNDKAINFAVYEAAKDKLLNIVDRPDLCSFHVPARFERGSLTVAISTDGISPALTKEIKKRLGSMFDESYENYLHFLKGAREITQMNVKDEKKRRFLLQQIATESFFLEKNWEESFHRLLREVNEK